MAERFASPVLASTILNFVRYSNNAISAERVAIEFAMKFKQRINSGILKFNIHFQGGGHLIINGDCEFLLVLIIHVVRIVP